MQVEDVNDTAIGNDDGDDDDDDVVDGDNE